MYAQASFAVGGMDLPASVPGAEPGVEKPRW
jgi:hypothetical protein